MIFKHELSENASEVSSICLLQLWTVTVSEYKETCKTKEKVVALSEMEIDKNQFDPPSTADRAGFR